jgi:uncharacterized protein (DUF58 family)
VIHPRPPKLTRDGWWATLLSLALLAVALVSRNNLVLLVATPLWAVLLLSFPIGRVAVKRIVPRRVLPGELYAGRDAAGHLVLLNPGGATYAIEVVDEGTGAMARAAHVPASGTAEVAVRWRFGQRGVARLDAVVVRSTFPFGFVEHSVRHVLPAEVVVWPRPLPAAVPGSVLTGEGAEEDERGRGTGDLLGLRAWKEGDPLRLVHARRSARMGSLLVVERAGETERTVRIVVPAGRGAAWERELSRACGEIVRALDLGRRVALVLPGPRDGFPETLGPSFGDAFRRMLLDRLATLPEST